MDKINVMLDPGAKMPTRAHDTDAGLDLYAMVDTVVPAGGSAIFDTGVHVEIPAGWAGFLKSKSGLNVKYDITSDGVIDAGYTGSIVVKLYDHGKEDHLIRAGEKVSQLVLLPVGTPELVQVDHFAETERGESGFGSTGA